MEKDEKDVTPLKQTTITFYEKGLIGGSWKKYENSTLENGCLNLGKSKKIPVRGCYFSIISLDWELGEGFFPEYSKGIIFQLLDERKNASYFFPEAGKSEVKGLIAGLEEEKAIYIPTLAYQNGYKFNTNTIDFKQLRKTRTWFSSLKKKDKASKRMLENDALILADYKAKKKGNLVQKGGVSANISTDDEEVELGPDFYDRYFNKEVIKAILFEELPPSTAKENAKVETPPKDDLSTSELMEELDQSLPEERNFSFPIKLYIAAPRQDIKNLNLNLPLKLALASKASGLWGLVHVGIQIRDKLVHFFDNHFVKIDEVKAENALYLINISDSGRLPLDEKIKDTIATEIVRWNQEAMYDQKLCNCQDFVEVLCDAINACDLTSSKKLSETQKLSFTFSENSLIKDYIDEITQIPKQAGMYFRVQGEIHIFRTHKQLDEWQIQRSSQLGAKERAFLKGYHRAFQLKEAHARRVKKKENPFENLPPPYECKSEGNMTLL